MNRLLRASVPSLLAVAAAAQAPADYTAHEWGTFTSMVGRDGFALDGLQHEEAALPAFVHDLLSVRESGRDDGQKLPASHVTQKMETPVIYFHTEQPVRVQARVWFQQGLMSQFYPLPSSITPTLDVARGGRIDMRTIDGSMLTWDVDLIPRRSGAPAVIPACAADDPWQCARQVDAAFVRTVGGADGKAKPEAEHFLFYRGLGRWTPPLQLRCGERAIALHNGMRGELPFVAAFELGDAGGRYVLGKPLAAGGDQQLPLFTAPLRQDRRELGRELGAHVLKALTDQGLHLDEARAMVATWSRSWFEQDGARVVYILPRQQVDEVLPLSLTPEPSQLVRVLVGRLEFITAEAQARDERALQQGDEAALRRLDRFLEPHLHNVARNGSSPAVRALAAARLSPAPK